MMFVVFELFAVSHIFHTIMQVRGFIVGIYFKIAVMR